MTVTTYLMLLILWEDKIDVSGTGKISWRDKATSIFFLICLKLSCDFCYTVYPRHSPHYGEDFSRSHVGLSLQDQTGRIKGILQKMILFKTWIVESPLHENFSLHISFWNGTWGTSWCFLLLSYLLVCHSLTLILHRTNKFVQVV